MCVTDVGLEASWKSEGDTTRAQGLVLTDNDAEWQTALRRWDERTEERERRNGTMMTAEVTRTNEDGGGGYWRTPHERKRKDDAGRADGAKRYRTGWKWLHCKGARTTRWGRRKRIEGECNDAEGQTAWRRRRGTEEQLKDHDAEWQTAGPRATSGRRNGRERTGMGIDASEGQTAMLTTEEDGRTTHRSRCRKADGGTMSNG
jgi:hypothetical protein